MKGIILAGGSGTRLYPLTMVTSKQLLPIYDKPMIYYPLSTLMLAGIRDILVISTENDIQRFKNLLHDGKQFGIHISYEVQHSPDGLAQAFLIGEKFLEDEPCAMVLGDNIFYGGWFRKNLAEAVKDAQEGNATIFGYYVNDPTRFGIVEFDNKKRVISLEEKPEHPKSNYCITGLYFYPSGVSKEAAKVVPSKRGELEITDLNRIYLNNKNLKVQILGRGFAWMDTGTMDSLMDASVFIQTIQKRQGMLISAPEEIAYHSGWISSKQLNNSAELYGKSDYGKHLKAVACDRLYFDRNLD
ncbi:MAG: glucose-1-phosphate thymidylyltransferase RfbA [Paludibacteraceae bacterium]|nr:glucose-1-phosphate thymidylyltransferase RfbA [Paludibacteraceae bacterium]